MFQEPLTGLEPWYKTAYVVFGNQYFELKLYSAPCNVKVSTIKF